MEKYLIKIAGLTRELPLCKVNDKLYIAAFIMFSDVELTIAAACALLKTAPEFDYIVTPECKSIPLVYEMSRQSGKKYIVLRKSAKVYMQNPVSVEVNSITTPRTQTLHLGEAEQKLLNGAKVLIVDDVISTGESLLAVEKLLSLCNAEIAAKACVLAEGNAADRTDIIYLEKLPLFLRSSIYDNSYIFNF